eukprot:TRINITY_DN10486_c0_g1_i1.p1 TRINITY_DN10486_c0_g1~~TRINITY_DN10486_c0_g1_i1.p1  ORF type:complete len:213 (+),score=63.64 TRINITY_DN10486_c0_g1_i1:57-695(+)
MKAIFFDLGGVVLDSPLHMIADYEKKNGIPHNYINYMIIKGGVDGPWAKLETGRYTVEEFCSEFNELCEKDGTKLDMREVFRIIQTARPRPIMIQAILRLRELGFQVAAITNNWKPTSEKELEQTLELSKIFDAFIESRVLGIRKPHPEIFQVALETLKVSASESIFLDDISANVRAAKKLGFTTIKVVEPTQALQELEGILNIELLPKAKL